MLIAGGIIAEKLNTEEQLILQTEFSGPSIGKINFSTKKYNNFADVEWDQEQIAAIASDPEKNRYFRDIDVTEISLVEPKSGRKFFYIRLKKDL